MKNRYNDAGNIVNRNVMFDNCVLMYLFYPIATEENRRQKKFLSYSEIFKRLLLNKNTKIINLFTVSEFVNAALRYELKKYNIENQEYKEFKEFRNSSEGIQKTNVVYDVVKTEILPEFELFTTKQYSKKEIENFLYQDRLDFNDKIIADLCKPLNCVLFTDDYDFSDVEIDILTANKKLLNR